MDDEDVVRESTARMLEELGYDLILASSAEAALQNVEAGRHFDILVTDHLMPGMTGVDLARVVQSRTARHAGSGDIRLCRRRRCRSRLAAPDQTLPASRPRGRFGRGNCTLGYSLMMALPDNFLRPSEQFGRKEVFASGRGRAIKTRVEDFG